MEQKHRTRKLVVNVSQESYKLLQAEAFRLDRHATNVSSDIVEAALQALKYSDPEFIESEVES